MPGKWKLRTDKETHVTYYWCGECELPPEQKEKLPHDEMEDIDK
jgi:hypothetical protein